MDSLDGPLIVTNVLDLFAHLEAEIINFQTDSMRHGDSEVEIKIDILKMTESEIESLPEYPM